MTTWLEHGDMRTVLQRLYADEAQVDAIVTDPPYELGFMGKKWDNTGIAFQSTTWRLCYDLLPPGGYLLAFSGTRTYHRMAVAIEEAGFEIRDMITWIYGQGFPKSKNIGDGWGTALKPAMEPICVARKPLDGTVAGNVLKHGVGALNIDGCRIDTAESTERISGVNGGVYGADNRKGMIRGGTAGRWPANVVHDGSDEVVRGFPSTKSGANTVKRGSGADVNGNQGAALHAESRPAGTPMIFYGDEGSASRFFYCAKANAKERMGFDHPTVKPITLLRWLVRMVTSPGGVVLDPFAGTGTMGAAAEAEGFDAILVEREAKYVGFIKERLPTAQVTTHG